MSHPLSFLVGLYLLAAQSDAPWHDPSPHQVRFVTVDSSVRLEVLDWGGTGRPILFVGCYLTGHVYDGIAPKLTDNFHVYAVTRRGVGASDRPATGYDPQRRAADIFEVIDSVGMRKPILIGNSCGGDILHTLGAQHPDRLVGLVYIDAAEDPTLTMADYDLPTVDRTLLPAFVGPSVPVTFPEAERRQMAERPLDPAIRRAIVDDNKVRSGLRANPRPGAGDLSNRHAGTDPQGTAAEKRARTYGVDPGLPRLPGDPFEMAARLTRWRSNRADCRAPGRQSVYVPIERSRRSSRSAGVRGHTEPVNNISGDESLSAPKVI